MKHCSLRSITLMVLGALFAAAAPAADRTWNNAAGGAFATAANWSGTLVPGTADRAIFNLAGPYTVTFAGNVTNDKLWINGGQVSFDLGGSSYELTNVTSGLTVGNGAIWSLAGGGTLRSTGTFQLGGAAGAGEIRLSGADTEWIYTGSLSVGASNSGTLRIAAGAAVSTSTIGYIGLQSGGTGSVTVTGAGSQWTVGDILYVGRLGGSGNLRIADGGSVSSLTGSIGGNLQIDLEDGYTPSAGDTFLLFSADSLGGGLASFSDRKSVV